MGYIRDVNINLNFLFHMGHSDIELQLKKKKQ